MPCGCAEQICEELFVLLDNLPTTRRSQGRIFAERAAIIAANWGGFFADYAYGQSDNTHYAMFRRAS